jgi:hypothetical protein
MVAAVMSNVLIDYSSAHHDLIDRVSLHEADRRHSGAYSLRCTDMLTALLFRFPFPGPWGKELTEAAHALAHDIANEDGLVWKIWLEDRDTHHAGGIYLFEDAGAAERYRAKHEHRLSAMGITGVTAHALSVNNELSVLTMAGVALGRARTAKDATTAAVAARS